MEKLDTVTVTGKANRADPLEPVFGQVFSVIGRDPAQNIDRIKANVAEFRKRNPGYDDNELVEMARNQMPQMVASAMRAITPAQEDAKKLEELRLANMRDRAGREFLSYGATAISGNEEARKNFVNAADEPYNAMKDIVSERAKARLADIDLAGKQLDIYGKAEKAGLEQAQFDPRSTDSEMMRRTIEGQLRAAGRADLIPQLEGKSAAQLKQLSDTITPIIEQKAKLAGIGKTQAEAALTGAQARGASAEAGLKEITSAGAAEHYRKTGTVPRNLRDQVYDDATIKRIEYTAERLNELQKGGSERTNIKATLNSIEKNLAKLSLMGDFKTNPALGTDTGKRLAGLVNDYQLLTKDLAMLEGRIGKNFGATDASKALGGRAAPDISKYPSTIRAIIAQMRAEIQRDDIILSNLQRASIDGGIVYFDESKLRDNLRTYNAVGNNRQVTATFHKDDTASIKRFLANAKKHGMKVDVLSTD